VIAGRLHPESGTRICVGLEEHKLDASGNSGLALTAQDCYPTTFGRGACSPGEGGNDVLADSDGAIRLMGDTENDVCMFKKYSGYNRGDEIWLKTCDAGNGNPNKAGKYWFSYDLETGRIFSEGSRFNDADNVMCLRITNPDMIYKQRVRIAPCNPNDVNQRFDVRDGRIYSRENTRVCAGYEFYKLRDAGASVGTPLLFNTCFPNAFAVDEDNFEN